MKFDKTLFQLYILEHRILFSIIIYVIVYSCCLDLTPHYTFCTGASGVVIFLLMMGTAFIGYVLPWGQMSFWGATVITNMATAISVIGEPIVRWLWGGYTKCKYSKFINFI